jgi:ribonuclease D
MSPGQIHRHGAALLRAVQRGLASEPIYPPKSPRPDERYLHRLEALRTWRKQAAQDMGAPSDVILPRELMYTIAEGRQKPSLI